MPNVPCRIPIKDQRPGPFSGQILVTFDANGHEFERMVCDTQLLIVGRTTFLSATCTPWRDSTLSRTFLRVTFTPEPDEDELCTFSMLHSDVFLLSDQWARGKDPC